MENTAKSFFEHLAQKNLSEKSTEEVNKWTTTEIQDFIVESKNLLPIKTLSSESIFDFVANSSLSGRMHPCVATSCRLSRVDSLARFASLYSNSILIRDPFPSTVVISGHKPLSEAMLRYELNTTLKVLFFLQPLIEKGIIGFAATRFHFCNDCYKKHVQDNNFEQLESKVYTALEKKFLGEVSYKSAIKDNFPLIEVTGPEELVEHGHSYRIVTNEKLLKVILKQVKAGKKHLSIKQIKEFKILSSDINPIVSDIVFQNFYSELYQSQYLTNQDIDYELLSVINHPEINLLSNSMVEGFGHSIPYLNNIEISKLIKLRDTEGEAFNVYRDSFTQAINSISEPNANKIKQAFNDIVRPELNNIELTIKNSRKLLWGALTQDIIVGTGFITVGLFSGLLPPNIGEIVAALGGFNFVAGSLDKISKLVKEPSEIRNNKYYFLWKAREQAKKL